jgi:hypothetical protein
MSSVVGDMPVLFEKHFLGIGFAPALSRGAAVLAPFLPELAGFLAAFQAGGPIIQIQPIALHGLS